jgi:hypothetical protein
MVSATGPGDRPAHRRDERTHLPATARARLARQARRQRAAFALAVLIPLLVSGLVVRTTQAAFTASTASTGNAWTAGHVSLTNNASGSAVITISQIVPGSTGVACVNVTYTGNVNAAVRLYLPAVTGSLGSYLDLQIDEGTGASDTACTGFSSSSTLYGAAGSGTLADFTLNHSGWASGVSAWAPAASSSDSRSYRLSWTLQDDNAAQSQTATAAFTWEVHNT